MKIKPKHTASKMTIFSEMSALAAKHNATNLAQGFPDYDIDEQLKNLLYKATKNNFNQYALMSGNPHLVENIIEFNKDRNAPIFIEKEEITIVPGATYGIYTALTSILQPNDEVVILEPAYDSYQPAIEMNGAKPIFVSLNPNDFTLDWELLNNKISEKTRAIIVNTPHNPTGKIWKMTDWEKLWSIIKDREIIVISDEVYDLLSFEPSQFVSILQHSELRNRAFAIFSFGKMFHITGWKVGYIVAPENHNIAFRQIHQYLTFSVNSPAQEALANYLEIFNPKENQEMMLQKRDFFLSEIKKTPFEIPFVAEGSYFQMLGYQAISTLPDKEFAYCLTENHKVASIPVSGFFHDKRNTNLVRFCFAKKEETILQAIQNLENLS